MKKDYLSTGEGILNYIRHIFFIYIWAVPMLMFIGKIPLYILPNKIGIFAILGVGAIGVCISLHTNFKYMSSVKFRHSLTTEGIYSVTRNPLYVGQTLYSLGFAGIFIHWSGILAFVLLVIFNHITILNEESNLTNRFGEKYLEYKKNTSRYLFF